MRTPKLESISSLLGEDYTDLIKTHWPDVDPSIYPTGINILVQLLVTVKTKTLKNGVVFWLPDEKVDADKARCQTALVRAIGPTAYRNRTTLKLWPEGHWCVPGLFIRTPMYGGDRMEVEYTRPDGSHDFALFVTFRDQDCLSIVTGDPTAIKSS